MEDTPLSGNRFNLYRIVNNAPVFVCIAVNLSLVKSKDFDDSTMPDCNNPLAIPDQKSVVKRRSWTVSFGGKMAMNHYADFEADYNSEAPVAYRVAATPIDNNGGGTWDGLLHIESLTMSKSDNGIVSFSASARGDGPCPFTAT